MSSIRLILGDQAKRLLGFLESARPAALQPEDSAHRAVEEGSGSIIKAGILEFGSNERHRLLIPPAEVIVGARETYHQIGVRCPSSILGVLDVVPQIERELQMRGHVRHGKGQLGCGGRGERRHQRLVRPIGIEPVMEQRRRGRLSPFEGLADGPVEPRAASGRQIVIQRLPQQSMSEHKLVGTVPLIDDPGVHRCIHNSVDRPLVESRRSPRRHRSRSPDRSPTQPRAWTRHRHRDARRGDQ